MTDTPAVRIRGLRKTYGDTVAVAGLDLDVADGEVVALLGPNGAGKTTTIEILEGHRDRDAGEVSVLGHDPARTDLDWRAQIGIVTQDGGDLLELTVREAVGHFAHYYPRHRDPDQAIDLVGLTEKATERVRTLSGGQRRRLDVAIGVVGRPRLLFLDEPTTGFDPQARRQFWALIRRLADEGCTILLSTHYLEEAEALADRVAVIMGGRIVADATPATLGGRATARTVVRWADGRQETDDPAGLIATLTRRYGGTVPGLTVSRPSLEDIYLDLIGDAS
ncbi:ABC-2 type transport system ATP-binding protein [Micromonospora phaseoli]|uniref:ABC-2 type transport system ATP-binding protein n=1 Tax=Micromonospora phaseoli TaxID=1144548 RepID=A0A1H7DWU0_9ACTN|nr:ABC transporter ATP-binding protein [Micromonospora phaseoli]PZV89430.1 ABC-2 type transport system ATP-binding protein [Micromonospora phaseoli]GIJ80253.1 ABC transporter [Micromonospora phaseoli]SEK02755.1 ABC-2 type transport system ATP-binding protein [Micromonospora phaseoli]